MKVEFFCSRINLKLPTLLDVVFVFSKSMLSQFSPLFVSHSHVLIFKLGGRSLSVSVLHIQGGVYQTLATQVHTNVNGNLITDQLVKVAAEDFKR